MDYQLVLVTLVKEIYENADKEARLKLADLLEEMSWTKASTYYANWLRSDKPMCYNKLYHICIQWGPKEMRKIMQRIYRQYINFSTYYPQIKSRRKKIFKQNSLQKSESPHSTTLSHFDTVRWMTIIYSGINTIIP